MSDRTRVNVFPPAGGPSIEVDQAQAKRLREKGYTDKPKPKSKAAKDATAEEQAPK